MQANAKSNAPCDDCDFHYYASSPASTKCEKCPMGYELNNVGGAECLSCGAGKYGNASASMCLECVPGLYRNPHASSDDSSCVSCTPGFYQPSRKSSSCLMCIPGRSTSESESVSCVPCSVDEYALETNSTSCSKCIAGKYTNGVSGSASCQLCPGGKAGAGCQDCIPGKYRGNTDPSNVCLSCAAGLHSIDNGQPFCLDCDPGRYAANVGSAECSLCPLGRYESEKRATTPCKYCKGATLVPNPKRSGCEMVPNDPNSAVASLISVRVASADAKSLRLTYRLSMPPKTSTRTSRSVVERGDQLELWVSTHTDFTVSYLPTMLELPFTEEEEKEKDGVEDVEEKYLEFSFVLPPSNTSSVATDGTTLLQGLGSAWSQLRYFRVRVTKSNGGRGPMSTRNDAWIVSDKCSDTMYLSTHPNDDLSKEALPLVLMQENDDASNATQTPECRTCPDGANCRGARTYAQIESRQGYRELPWNVRLYGQCPRAVACPGDDVSIVPPELLFDSDGGNSTRLDPGCATGHRRLFCSECEHYFDTKLGDPKGLCAPCPDNDENILRVSTLAICVIAALAFLVSDSLDGIDKISAHVAEGEDASVPFHSVGIRIMSSFMQVAGLLNNFRLSLPNAVVTLMTVLQTSSGVGGAVISFNCLLPETRGVSLLLIKLITTVIVLPMALAVLVVLFWLVHGLFCHKKSESGAGPMDKMVGSMLVLYYLTFPSMLHGMTQAMSCTTYGPYNNPSSRVLLDGALDVECYGVQHRLLLLSVVVPAFVVFVVIVPALVVYTMHREYLEHRLLPHQDHFNPVSCYRYGFLFLGYEQEFYGFELAVMLRKAALVVVGGLLRPYGSVTQVIGASSILIVSLSIHLQHRPYDSDGHDTMESVSLHASLAILMSVLVCSKVGALQDGTTLGPTSSIVLIVIVFASVGIFFYVSLTHITKHSHDHKGLLGMISRACTKQSKNDRRHSIVHGERQPRKIRRGSTARGAEGTVKGTKKFQVAPRRASRGLTMTMVQNAVVEHRLVKFEKAHDEQHAKSLDAIKARQKDASSRVRQRLIRRRTLKEHGGEKKESAKNIFDDDSAVLQDGRLAKEIRIALKSKVQTFNGLEKLFERLDVEHSGMLTRKECVQMITSVMQSKVEESLLDVVWNQMWEQRKHGADDEMDASTMAHWLEIDVPGSSII